MAAQCAICQRFRDELEPRFSHYEFGPVKGVLCPACAMPIQAAVTAALRARQAELKRSELVMLAEDDRVAYDRSRARRRESRRLESEQRRKARRMGILARRAERDANRQAAQLQRTALVEKALAAQARLESRGVSRLLARSRAAAIYGLRSRDLVAAATKGEAAA